MSGHPRAVTRPLVVHSALRSSPRAVMLLVLATIAIAGCGAANDTKAAPPAPVAEGDEGTEQPFLRKIPAPDLGGGTDWINTAGPLDLKDLRGKFVILDFWTYCCINCMHILPELKKLENQFPKELVVIGVHSAKFETEEDSKNIAEAVLRNEIKHPVVNDSKHAIWNRYGIQSWPTVILIDPEGNAVYVRSAEFKAEEVAAVLRHGLPYYRKKGKLDETPLEFDMEARTATPTPLRFPGKILADEAGGRLFIADSNHNRIVVAKTDGTLVDTIGSGAIGAADGDFRTAAFNHPQGMVLSGNTLYIADTENHNLRKADLSTKQVTTIAGLGTQASFAWPGMDIDAVNAGRPVRPPERYVGRPRETALNSPWDVLIHGRDLYIAMAGPHQIWKMPLDESEIGPYAGNGREDIADGPLLPKEPGDMAFCSFAQPSGLASDGHALFVADSEGSSIRTVPFEPKKKVGTVVGTAHAPRGSRLFTFGDHDGSGNAVRLQHPLGVAWHDGKLYVADTYNNKIKVLDVAKKSSQTLAGSGKSGHDDGAAEEATFDEPAGLAATGGKLYVADTNSHLIRTIDLENGNRVGTLEIKGLTPPQPPEEARPADGGKKIAINPVTLKPTDGLVWLAVKLELPEGWDINKQAPMRYKVTATSATGPIDRKAIGQNKKVDPLTEFQIELPLSATAGNESVDVTVDYYYCRKGAEGVCKAGTTTWTVPITIDAKAEKSTAPLVYKVE